MRTRSSMMGREYPVAQCCLIDALIEAYSGGVVLVVTVFEFSATSVSIFSRRRQRIFRYRPAQPLHRSRIAGNDYADWLQALLTGDALGHQDAKFLAFPDAAVEAARPKHRAR